MIYFGKNDIRNRLRRAACCLAAATTISACIKEELPAPDDGEGQPTRVEVALELPAMEIQTRAMMSEKDDSQVNTLWVGTFLASTGVKSGSAFSEVNRSDQHVFHTLTLDTKSGPSRIAGVANVDDNYGTTDNETLLEDLREAGKRPTQAGYYTLRDLLEVVRTWEQYRSIRAAHINPANVSSFAPNLIMAGIYHSAQTSDPATWNNEATVTIPSSQNGKVTLPGAIHLRRLLAYVRFDIRWEAAAGITDLEVDLKSWRVVHNPTYSYLHEQAANAGDAAWERSYAASNLSRNFESTTRPGDARTYRTFDFYQYENRHTGLDGVTVYADREREHKLDGGGNSGIYASLCPEAEDGPANRATYVEIEAEVAYATTIDGVRVDRTGTARYCVHLGYCEGADEAARARDFNCRRNTKYTYTMVIRGLDKIVVEARREGEELPGAEGEVFDTYEQTIDLDAHYGTFNIQLSNRERASLDYTIQAPYDDTARQIVSSELRAAGAAVEEQIRLDGHYDFYQWIRFRPTTGEEVLAKYKSGPTDAEPWTLEQLRDVAGHPHAAGADDPDDDTQRWYTVFVDEYVYHGTTDDGNEVGNAWWLYVNKDPRTVYLAIRESEVSDDGESRYGYSKYLIRQQSIQTYYATSTVGGSRVAGRALGAEHTNETYGLNLRWTDKAKNAAPSQTETITGSSFVGYDWNPDNGRVNIWQYLNHAGNGRQWETYFAIADGRLTQGEIPARLSSTPDPGVTPQSGKYYLPQLRQTRGTGYNRNHGSAPAAEGGYPYDPNTTDAFYEVMELCLSRNRDLNGNGVIDPEEIRWYLPALGKYTRMVLGRQSLKDPLLDPNDFDMTRFPGRDGDASNPWFHYVSSDGMVLLNEQGLSLERKGVEGSGWYNSAWQVRCIRNLGCNLTEVVESDPVQMAYEIDPAARTVEMTYYDQSSIRQQAMNVIPMHPITSELNLPYKKFQYAREDCTESMAGYNATLIRTTNSNGYVLRLDSKSGSGNYLQIAASDWEASNNDNSICGLYSEEADGSDRGTWRVPNQKELTIMRRGREEVFDGLPASGWMWQWLSCSRFMMGQDTRVAGIYFNYGRGASNPEQQRYWSNGYMEYHNDPVLNRTYTHVRCVRDVVE